MWSENMDADGQGRWVRAIDDFLAQSETDLAFGTGDVIQLVRFADENWAVGRLNGKQGIFPICFTEPTQQPTPPTQKEDQPPQPPPRWEIQTSCGFFTVSHNQLKVKLTFCVV